MNKFEQVLEDYLEESSLGERNSSPIPQPGQIYQTEGEYIIILNAGYGYDDKVYIDYMDPEDYMIEMELDDSYKFIEDAGSVEQAMVHPLFTGA